MAIDKNIWKPFREKLKNYRPDWNPMLDLENAFAEFFPGYKLAFVSEDDYPYATSQGWVPLKPEYFPGGIDQYNSQVEMRHGLTVRDGAIWWRSMILCIMPSDLRRQMEAKRREAAEKAYRGGSEDVEAVRGLTKHTKSEVTTKQVPLNELAAEGAPKRRRGR